jgi:hypothetical protein
LTAFISGIVKPLEPNPESNMLCATRRFIGRDINRSEIFIVASSLIVRNFSSTN